jgi:hypothetical protein
MLKFRLGLFVLLALVLAAGCHRTNAPSKVSGKVTYKGQPVKAGNIIFHSEDSGSYPASLNQDGTYEIVDVPMGAMTVTVETEFLNPDKRTPGYPGMGGLRSGVGQGAAKGAAMDKERVAAERKAGVGGPLSKEDMAARYVKVPLKYGLPRSSPLKVTLEAGKQVKDFDLTD